MNDVELVRFDCLFKIHSTLHSDFKQTKLFAVIFSLQSTDVGRRLNLTSVI